MEAENYLASGYGLRLAIKARAAGWKPFSEYARVWQPSRLKGIQVAADVGTPFLAATQVFDVRPVPRKWLAIERTHEAKDRFVSDGTIVVTCSGAVGRATLLHAPHAATLISHDLLRVTPNEAAQWGWIYAYLRSAHARSMMTSAKYGHMIKHLEPSHLDALPVPVVNDKWAKAFQREVKGILELRNSAHECSVKAEGAFEDAVGSFKAKDWGEAGYSVKAAGMTGGRRRLEGAFHNPGTAQLRQHLAKNGKGFSTLADDDFDIWVPGRYKRIPAEDGVEYYDSADLLEVCPDITKRFADCDFGDAHRGRVQNGWLLVPCSGQVYGIIGSVAFAGTSLDGKVVSNHVMRLAARPGSKLRAGYVLTALTHPTLGRPLVKALPFGSSVPEIDPQEFANLPIVRLAASQENRVADLAEEAGTLIAKADVQEREIASKADALIDKFVAGDVTDFITG